jgi:hypothetical protein
LLTADSTALRSCFKVRTKRCSQWIPVITLEGDANGAPHPDASSYAKKFSGKYSHRIIKGGVGHNLPG